MTLDLSELKNDQRKTLESNPELLRSLEEAIPMQIQRMQMRKAKLSKGKGKWQRDLEDIDKRVEEAKSRAEELRQKYSDTMMEQPLKEIQEKILQKMPSTEIAGLRCPVCGESDKNNKMNGRAWCIKCNSSLVAKDKIERWKKLGNIKIAYSKITHPTFIEEEK